MYPFKEYLFILKVGHVKTCYILSLTFVCKLDSELQLQLQKSIKYTESISRKKINTKTIHPTPKNLEYQVCILEITIYIYMIAIQKWVKQNFMEAYIFLDIISNLKPSCPQYLYKYFRIILVSVSHTTSIKRQRDSQVFAIINQQIDFQGI